MVAPCGQSLGVKITSVFMRCSGIWVVDFPREKRIMEIITIYSVITLTLSFGITLQDFYFCYGDLTKVTYCAMNTSIVGLSLTKQVIFTRQRKTYLHAIIYAKNNFWFYPYDDYGDKVMKQCNARSGAIIILIIVICHVTLILYGIRPLLANRGKNESNRVLPVQLWVDLPIERTPWYEILFVMEMVMTYHCCICYFCFDTFVCLINISVVGKFTILQRKLRSVCGQVKDSSVINENSVYSHFRECVINHQDLLKFVEVMKNLHKNIIVIMVLVHSFQISVELYQITMIKGEYLYRFHAFMNLIACIIQLFFFILTCNDLTEASTGVSHAAYDVQWFLIQSNALKKKLGNDLAIVIARSQRPCSFAVGGFSAVNLQTFTSICKAAFSYVTLLRQSVEVD